MRIMQKHPPTARRLRFGCLAMLAQTLVMAALVMAASMPVHAGEHAAPWVEGFNNKVRLISGSASGGPYGPQSRHYAGVEIVMSPGFKTYWRNPGEAGGVPPEFDFAGSENLASATVLYPVPHRTKDKAGENIAYKDRVVFPVLIVPKDPAVPVSLKLKAAYGVCKDICIPAEADLSTRIPADVERSSALQEALATVPILMRDPMRPLPDGAVHDPMAAIDPTKDPVLSAWRIDDAQVKPKIIFDVNDPGGGGADAFLFSPDGAYLPMSKKVSEGNRKAVFEVDLSDGADLKDLAGKAIFITLGGVTGQSETKILLPKVLATP